MSLLSTGFNPDKLPYAKISKGSMIGMSNGQVAPVGQWNGFQNGEVVFKIPEVLLEGEGVFDGFPDLLKSTNKSAIMSLNAQDKDGNALFTAGINAGQVLPCLLNSIGIVRVKENDELVISIFGQYDPSNPSTTANQALSLNKDIAGRSSGIATMEVSKMQLPSGVSAWVGAKVMGGWSNADHFLYAVPILTRDAKTGINTDGSNDIAVSQMDDFIVEIESLVDGNDGTTSAIGANTILTPGLDSAKQILGTTLTSDIVDISYKYASMARVIPVSQLHRLSIGEIVGWDGNSGGYIFVDHTRR